MIRKDETDWREFQRRMDAFIATACACHMSDAKWRKLFRALGELRVGRMAWKFVRSDRILYQPPPPPQALLRSCLGDFGLTAGSPYREIDWVEVPNERAAGVAEGLATVGRFPVERLTTGLRIVGYTWPRAETASGPPQTHS
ncbi:hypothetical protein GobsT_28610 [Gemmata obscuriglobus]|uniref:Uncharacterized protein n=1 Tax=Gemmata obscuriglobus TaxID=114 RepID=A0A2Z3HCE4_9BACT|nr:hypothetical protein C1280_19240 [Gemmata obscuriglobus]QEG28088.1 hypothetical protein GobsT_28610 [Gemmata obscuriglobus]VTS05708.1 Uncharacterized protein OS=Rhodopirellula baltica SWK14 GN=RBSWK_05981 PE=4 SV=1 [Gemmata obscuriglobus UQM 2246]